MKQRVFIVFDHDIVKYPPTLSLISILLELNYEVSVIGYYSDKEGKRRFEENGVVFYDIRYSPNLKIKNYIIRNINILKHLRKYRKEFYSIVDSIEFRDNDLIWFIFSDKALFSYDFLKKRNYIVQFYEFVDANFGGKYKYIYPKYDIRKLLRDAQDVVHCEYNRASIMNGMYGVNGRINVLPNKPFIDESLLKKVPVEITTLYNDIKKSIGGRKAILYQGVFNSEERRLEEFCDAMNLLPDDYVFVAMGNGEHWDSLKCKYNTDKHIFIPFVKPPYHLLFTQLASIGVLNYLPVPKSIADVINPIYCAPNKIYEYTKYGKPIICNDIPALRSEVDKYNCGVIAKYPMAPHTIAETILRISDNYEEFSNGACRFYESVDMKLIVANIIKKG